LRGGRPAGQQPQGQGAQNNPHLLNAATQQLLELGTVAGADMDRDGTPGHTQVWTKTIPKGSVL